MSPYKRIFIKPNKLHFTIRKSEVVRWFDIVCQKSWLGGSYIGFKLSVFLGLIPPLLLVSYLKLANDPKVMADNFSNTSSLMDVADDYATDIELLAVYGNPAPLDGRGGPQAQISADGTLTAVGLVSKDKVKSQSRDNIAVAGKNGEIRVYTVREGDSLSEIADMFSVSVNTIIWSNDLSSAEQIKPGQDLIILPVDGIVHVVKKGDTLSSLAKKYQVKTEDIIAFNHLSATTGLTVGMDLVIPNAVITNTRTTGLAVKNNKSGNHARAKTIIKFIHPVPGSVRTQGIHGNNAVDLANTINTPIRAAAAGRVLISRTYGWNGGYGQYIVIEHKYGVQTLYSHLNKNYVGVGDWVSAGQVIGLMGSTGRSTGSHLHFEVRGDKNIF